MSFPILPVPVTTNDPADDQPDMLANFNNIGSYLSVDHVTAGSAGNGRHTQVHFNAPNSPSSPTAPATDSYNYSGVGVEDPTFPQNYYKNALATFPLSCIKAFCYFTTTSTGVLPTLSPVNNISATTHTGALSQTYTFTMGTSVLPTDNAVVQITINLPSLTGGFDNFAYNYSITAGVLTLNLFNGSGTIIPNGIGINITVIQI